MWGHTNGRWRHLPTDEVSEHDAEIVYALRCSLLHGYGPPKQDKSCGRRVLLTNDRTAYALDTSYDGVALLSVPVFCGRLVERIAAEASGNWDDSLINTNYRL